MKLVHKVKQEVGSGDEARRILKTAISDFEEKTLCVDNIRGTSISISLKRDEIERRFNLDCHGNE